MESQVKWRTLALLYHQTSKILLSVRELYTNKFNIQRTNNDIHHHLKDKNKKRISKLLEENITRDVVDM